MVKNHRTRYKKEVKLGIKLNAGQNKHLQKQNKQTSDLKSPISHNKATNQPAVPYDLSKRWVFSLDLKRDSSVQLRIDSGRIFHSLGPAT